jgi:hypothetical protein
MANPLSSKLDASIAYVAGKYGLAADLLAKLNAAAPKTLYDANSILIANADDTPEALAVAASRIVGRAAAGGIAALTPAQLQTLLGVGAGAAGALPLHWPPAALGQAPHAFDTEFDTDPGWLSWSLTAAAAKTPDAAAPSTIAPWQPGATGAPRVSVNALRKSWALVQPAAGSELLYYAPTLQTPTFPCWYWARIGGYRQDSGGNPGRAILYLVSNNGGVPATTRDGGWVGYLNDGGGATTYSSGYYAGGSNSSLGGLTAAQSASFEYVAIYRTSTTMQAFVFNEAGDHFMLSQGADVRTSFFASLYFISPSHGQAVFGVDFVRCKLGSTPPWVR